MRRDPRPPFRPRCPHTRRFTAGPLAVCLALVAAASAFPVRTLTMGELPPRLQDTGLYADWQAKTVAPQNLAYSPQYPLWSDGAGKTRWLSIPRGKWIEASNADRWIFPVGTRLWKEFQFNGHRVETRFIERTAHGWLFATYQWNGDETEAPLAPEFGVARSAEIRPGVRHSIPSRTDCLACHAASDARVLGINALQLSADRDPNAPHAEPLPEGGVDLHVLVDRGILRGLPPRYLRVPPRIDAPTPTARAALGYLNTNCGICHTSGGQLASLGFSLRYSLALPLNASPAAIVTAVGRPSHFQVPGVKVRLSPGNPDASVLVARISSRNPVTQMPPLGTHIIDDDAVRLIRKWITDDLPVVQLVSNKQKKETKR
jgi:mono/diheme cytochrome c family protein